MLLEVENCSYVGVCKEVTKRGLIVRCIYGYYAAGCAGKELNIRSWMREWKQRRWGMELDERGGNVAEEWNWDERAEATSLRNGTWMKKWRQLR